MHSPRRVCVVDSLAADCEAGRVPTQGGLLADYLAREGLTVLKASTQPGKLMRALDMALTLSCHLEKYDVALIQVFGRRAFEYARLSSWIAKKLNKKVVLVLRGGMLPLEWQHQPERLQQVFDRADAIIAPSSYMASFFREAGYPITVIPNFIEIERYPFRLRSRIQPRFFWMRGFHQQYNPQMAIGAFALLKKKFHEAVLSMGGPDGGELGACQRLASKLGVAESVRFLGLLTKDRIVAEADKHDIHLHTNRIDNMPVTLIENMALGLPIVATRVGGVPYLVRDGETALLVESENVEAMAAAMARLLTDSGLVSRLSQAGRQFVEQTCTWPAIRNAWLSVLCGN